LLRGVDGKRRPDAGCIGAWPNEWWGRRRIGTKSEMRKDKEEDVSGWITKGAPSRSARSSKHIKNEKGSGLQLNGVRSGRNGSGGAGGIKLGIGGSGERKTCAPIGRLRLNPLGGGWRELRKQGQGSRKDCSRMTLLSRAGTSSRDWVTERKKKKKHGPFLHHPRREASKRKMHARCWTWIGEKRRESKTGGRR